VAAGELELAAGALELAGDEGGRAPGDALCVGPGVGVFVA
jgi:hypothetical protein